MKDELVREVIGALDAWTKLLPDVAALQNKLQQALEPEWVPEKGELVLARDVNSQEWTPFIFSSREPGSIYPFRCFKGALPEGPPVGWMQCKPHPTISRVLYMKRWEGGECPVDAEARVQVKLHDGENTYRNKAGTLDWSHDAGNPGNIIEYVEL